MKKKKRNTASERRKKLRLVRSNPAASTAEESIEHVAATAESPARNVGINGGPLDAWLDDYQGEPLDPEYSLEPSESYGRGPDEPKMQREAAAKMGAGKSSPRVLRDKPSHRPRSEDNS